MGKTRAMTGAAVLALALGTAGAQHGVDSHHAGAPSPYAGEQGREIKALSAQEQRGWLEGQGMGLARAAELNGHPGPMHVLELADALQLTPAQAAATRRLMDAHKAEVRAWGSELVQGERALDAMFTGPATAVDVQRQTLHIAVLQGRIRAAHLVTHLAQSRLLAPEQVEAYQRLRGYRP